MNRSELKQIIKEAIEDTKNYALGYRQGFKDYETDEVQRDLRQYPPQYQNGYKVGIKDARRKKWDTRITRILVALGQSLKVR